MQDEKRHQEVRNKRREERRKRGVCTECGGEVSPGYVVCPKHLESQRRSIPYISDRNRRRRAENRLAVLSHYGSKCACCGESEELFLEIDHINNDGAEERRYGRGRDIYASLIERGFPDTYQILCSNCNRGKYRNGGVCPHHQQ